MSYKIQDDTLEAGITQVREVRVSYRGARRTLEAPLRSPDHVSTFAQRLIAGDAREHFVVIHLDGRHRPIGYQIASVGTATASLIHPREVFQPAIAVGAAAVILCHNHPSGDPAPSTEDHAITKRLIEAGQLLGIQVLDHVICGERHHYSTREREPEWFSIA